jgi:hypothetical protein
MGLISGSLVVVEFMHPVNTELNDTKIKKHREEVFTEILIDLWFKKWGFILYGLTYLPRPNRLCVACLYI